MRIAIIGGGITGLAAAYALSKKSTADIVLVEKNEALGGLAGSFEIQENIFIETYYHFICKPDRTYLRLVRELGMASCVRWKTTRMDLFYQGHLHALGDPLSLFLFKHLSAADKMRFAWATWRVKTASADAWKNLERVPARDWLIKAYGENTYRLLYEPLIRLKFREHAGRIPAAWMWARFHRLGRSRTVWQGERIGYLSGGSRSFIDRMEKTLRSRNVSIRLGTEIKSLLFEKDAITGIRTQSETIRCDHCISTIPLPVLKPMVESLQGPYWDGVRAMDSTGVVVCILRLARRLSPYFWMNISDPRIDLAGIIEYTQLNPLPALGGDAIVYIPQYVPETHPLFRCSDDRFVQMHVDLIRSIEPRFNASWIRGHWIFRERFSQPICDLDFSRRTPSMQTPLSNFHLTDSHQLHPYDRAISGSCDLGERVAEQVLLKMH